MAGSIASRVRRTRKSIARKQIAYDFNRVFTRNQPYLFPVGTHNFVVPVSGPWRFAVWGGGAGAWNPGLYAGGSGALYSAKRFLERGQIVALVVGHGGFKGQNGANSTATFPNGEVITAAGALGNTGAVAPTANRPEDIVFAGSNGGSGGTGASGVAGLGDAGGAGGAGASGTMDGGGGAPGFGSLRGGDGQSGTTGAIGSGETPAGGGGMDNEQGRPGGHGLIIAYLDE
jgi:hypothetical protein